MENNIKYINDYIIIKEILKKFDKQFEPSLSERIVSLDDYALKLINNAKIIGYKIDNNIIGFAAFYCNDKENSVAFLTQIAVDKNQKKLGYGSKLLNEAEKISKEQGMKKMRLEVYNDNELGLNFYKKNGYIYEKKCSDKSSFMIKELR